MCTAGVQTASVVTETQSMLAWDDEIGPGSLVSRVVKRDVPVAAVTQAMPERTQVHYANAMTEE